MARILSRAVWGCILVAFVSGCGEKKPVELKGCGSTFVSPLMVQWSADYERSDSGCKLDYESGGSGYGIRSLIAKKHDFICTDAPLTDEQLAKASAAGGALVHVPLVLGAVVPAYNLPEISEPLRFTGPVLARIYMGKDYPGKEEEKILTWNHPDVKALNPRIADELDKLPNKEIVVVHRSDGSGTTYIWVDYLSKVSKEWEKKVGRGTEVTWPTGLAGVGNGGVAKKVKETPYSIGYVELSFAFRLDLQTGLVQNQEKEFIRASPDSVRKAGDNGLVNIPEDLRYSLTDPPGKGSYPICGTTWAVVYIQQPKEKGWRVVDFLLWTLDKGQEDADMLLYVRLPEALHSRSVAQIKKIQAEK